jgi:ankyrin repeat protein
MTTQPLPARPNLEQLKRQAKELLRAARAQDPAALARFRALPGFIDRSDPEFAALHFALHDAQSAVAREYGFASWNALLDRVEALTLKFDEAVAQFTRGSVEQRLARAERALALFPDLIAKDFHAALAYGNVVMVERLLAADSSLATRRGGPLDWEPILYVAHSQWAAKNSDGLLATAKLLLERGADPNTTYAWAVDPQQKLPVLWAAACHSRHLALARLLLEAGAKSDDRESVYHAAENGDIEMLDLLAAHGAHADGGEGNRRWGNTPLYFILGHHAGMARDAAVRRGAEWLLAHGADPNRVCYPDKSGETPVHAAARHWDVSMMDLLARHGANLRARRADGRTAFALASLHGNVAVVDWLRAHDGADELSAAERFLAACARGDRPRVEAMLRGAPQLREIAKHPGPQKLFFEIAARRETAALETMLACGFDVAATDDMGATALHWAAFTGTAAAARVLLAHGAPVDVRDRTYNASPLGWADYAACNRTNPDGDYTGVAQLLIEAGVPLPSDDELENWGSDEIVAIVRHSRRQH